MHTGQKGKMCCNSFQENQAADLETEQIYCFDIFVEVYTLRNKCYIGIF